MPDRFRARLEHALAHYGVADLEPTPELHEALYRIFVAHQRRADHVAIITALLGQQLADHRSAPQRAPGLRDLLDRLIDATYRPWPGIANMARSVRYRCFDEPIVVQARGEVDAAIIDDLALLRCGSAIAGR